MDIDSFSQLRIAVTGACGTVGSELVKQLVVRHKPAEVLCIDNNESEVFFLEQKFGKYGNTSFFMADIRDAGKLARLFQGVDLVFHAAAYKHVILCERSPFEAVRTNIIGLHNALEAALQCKVRHFIFTSSDKAVNPTNVMGTSKLMGERLVTSFSSMQRGPVRNRFASTRFGNVLGSRGSVIPIFRQQIAYGGPITLTDSGMTRFIMSIEEAVRLVIDSALLACGGEVFVTKMPVIRIADLANVMIRELAPLYGYDPADIPVQTIGTKPGEKLYEELMNEEELRRTVELPRYFAVLPALRAMYGEIDYNYSEKSAGTPDRVYHSGNETCLSEEELRDFLVTSGLLREDGLAGAEEL